jgi:hypothetical protein
MGAIKKIAGDPSQIQMRETSKPGTKDPDRSPDIGLRYMLKGSFSRDNAIIEETHEISKAGTHRI